MRYIKSLSTAAGAALLTGFPDLQFHPGAELRGAPLPQRRPVRHAGHAILLLLLLIGLAAAAVYVLVDLVLAPAGGLGPHSPGPLPHPVPVPNPAPVPPGS